MRRYFNIRKELCCQMRCLFIIQNVPYFEPHTSFNIAFMICTFRLLLICDMEDFQLEFRLPVLLRGHETPKKNTCDFVYKTWLHSQLHLRNCAWSTITYCGPYINSVAVCSLCWVLSVYVFLAPNFKAWAIFWCGAFSLPPPLPLNLSENEVPGLRNMWRRGYVISGVVFNLSGLNSGYFWMLAEVWCLP